MKEEHARMMCERENMATNDREDLFKRHYNNVMEELQRQAEAEQVMKDERQKEYGTISYFTFFHTMLTVYFVRCTTKSSRRSV